VGFWQTNAVPVLHAGLLQAFSQSVVYTPASTAVPETIEAIFDAYAATITVEGGQQIQGTAPTLSLRLADLTVYPKARDTLTIAGVAYRVDSIEPEGDGWALLRVSETT